MSKSHESGNPEPGKELQQLRQQIDRIDQSLVLLLANRFALTRKVGEIKASAQLESFDPQREAQKLVDIRDACTRHDLNPDMMADILAQIMREAVSNHERIKAEIAQSLASG
jgi:chorismate mutase